MAETLDELREEQFPGGVDDPGTMTIDQRRIPQSVINRIVQGSVQAAQALPTRESLGLPSSGQSVEEVREQLRAGRQGNETFIGPQPALPSRESLGLPSSEPKTLDELREGIFGPERLDKKIGRVLGEAKDRIAEDLARPPIGQKISDLPPPGFQRIRGTSIDIPESAAAIARFGLEAAGDLAGFAATKKLPTGTASKVVNVGNRVLKAVTTGAGAGGGSLAAELIDPSLPGEAFDRARTNALLSTGTDLAIAGIGRAALAGKDQLINKFMAGQLEPGASQIIDQFADTGREVLPPIGRLSRRRAPDVLETVTEGAFISGRVQARLSRAAEEGQRELDKVVEELLEGSSRAQVMALSKELLEGGLDLFKADSSRLHALVDAAIAAEGKDTSVGLGRFFLEKAKIQNEVSPDRAGVRKVFRIIQDAIDKHNKALGLDAGANVVDELSFAGADELRSALLAMGRSQDPSVRAGEAAAKRLAQRLDEAMEHTGATLDGDAFAAFRRAKAFHRRGKETLANQSILAILRGTHADDVIEQIIRPGGINTLRQIRNVLFGGLGNDINIRNVDVVIKRAQRVVNDKTASAEVRAIAQRRLDQAIQGQAAFKKLQGQFLFDAIAKADPNSGMFSRELFEDQKAFEASKLKSRFRNIGGETLKELFPDGATRKRIDPFIRLVEFSQAEAGRNIPGGMMIGLQQGHAFLTISLGVGAALGGIPPDMATLAGGIVVMGPAVVARLMDSDKAIKIMARGLSRSGPESQRIRAFFQLAQLAIQNGARFEDERGKRIQLADKRIQANRIRTGGK